jgi:hypothetical protein
LVDLWTDEPDIAREEFVRGALERTLDDEAAAAALARTMMAIATPLPAGVAFASRTDRPLLWRDGRYRAEATRRKRVAADPDRAFAAWSMVAQAAALRLLDRLTSERAAWDLLAEFDLIDADDVDLVRRALMLAR